MGNLAALRNKLLIPRKAVPKRWMWRDVAILFHETASGEKVVKLHSDRGGNYYIETERVM